MEEIKLENGSVIRSIDGKITNIRGLRSKLMSFYCSECKCVHEDYPIENVKWIFNDYSLCKESYENYLK